VVDCLLPTRPPNGLELSCPAEAGRHPLIVAHAGGPGTPPYPPARRVSCSELFGGTNGTGAMLGWDATPAAGET
jgi:hypothetical protein